MGKFFCVKMEEKLNNNKKNCIARVSEVQRDLFTVIYAKREVKARLKGLFYKGDSLFPVIGDYVEITYQTSGESMIEKILERKTSFSRLDLLGHNSVFAKNVKEQTLAVNFDIVFIVSSLNQNFNINRIARYLSVSHQSGAKPVVVLTKLDLCDNPDDYINQVHSLNRDVEICTISSLTKEGMDQINHYLKPDTTIVFLGSSGVGKSTLVNLIAGKQIMEVSGIRESDAMGRHTTSYRQLLVLENGVTIIDTPGIRELGMLNVEEGINTTFSDITELIQHCKFSNCSHQSEPGCAINHAIKHSSLDNDRWKLYLQLQKENEWGKRKSIKNSKG